MTKGLSPHAHPCFYKYCTLDTALKVIGTKSFRWSSPSKFNDPFDHQTRLVLPLGFSQEISGALTRCVDEVVFAEPRPTLTETSNLVPALLAMRGIRAKMGRSALIEAIRPAAEQAAARMTEAVADLNETLLRQFSNSRVFCVTEKRNNVVMWSHYADEHRGVVFQLGCVPQIDSRLLAAQPVTYSKDFTTLPSAVEFARHLTGIEPFDMVELAWKIVFTKHEDWAYEKEWRLHFPMLDSPPGDGYSLVPEPFEVFQEVYLGCRCPDHHRRLIKEALAANLPQVKVFQARQSQKTFDLDFEPV